MSAFRSNFGHDTLVMVVSVLVYWAILVVLFVTVGKWAAIAFILFQFPLYMWLERKEGRF